MADDTNGAPPSFNSARELYRLRKNEETVSEIQRQASDTRLDLQRQISEIRHRIANLEQVQSAQQELREAVQAPWLFLVKAGSKALVVMVVGWVLIELGIRYAK